MKDKLLKLAKNLHPMHLTKLAALLLRDEATSGKLILFAATAALLAANTPVASTYESILHTKLTLGLGSWSLGLDLRHWVSEGLMAFFFLVVGLELKRELLHGELRSKRTALLPFAAAIGGMLVPGLIYVLFNAGRDTLAGWAIPTATDIALAIGLLALLGKRIPSSIRIFILTLAIVDDILAVIIIAVFYNSAVNLALVLLGLLAVVAIVLLDRFRLVTLPIFILSGVGLWLIAHGAGIHPSIVGALAGFLAPMTSKSPSVPSLAERIEKAIIPFSTLLVVPLFALANTGISLAPTGLEAESVVPIAGGIIVGLVVGKVVGIATATWLTVRLGLAPLPARSNWAHIIGVGLLAGIGFTVSIFVTELAFTNPEYITIAKLSIFAASAVSATLGLLVLRFASTKLTFARPYRVRQSRQ